jgi:hypothetical protein
VILGYIDRFGAQSVLGRLLTLREMRRMTMMDNIVIAYRSRQNATDKNKWVIDNLRGLLPILENAEKAWSKVNATS